MITDTFTHTQALLCLPAVCRMCVGNEQKSRQNEEEEDGML